MGLARDAPESGRLRQGPHPSCRPRHHHPARLASGSDEHRGSVEGDAQRGVPGLMPHLWLIIPKPAADGVCRGLFAFVGRGRTSAFSFPFPSPRLYCPHAFPRSRTMSEIMLNIRDATRSLHNTIHASRVDYLVAALSAEPETIAELEEALARYLPEEAPGFFGHWRNGVDERPWDAGWCVIDLAARLVVVESTYSLPGPRGHVEYRGETERGRALQV